MCKQQNQSGTKTFRIHHESGTISSSVNLVSGTLHLFTWRVGVQVSLIADAMGKGNFHIIFFKTQRFFMLDKCILKVKINPMRSSGFHDICRIKVIMTAFLATLYTSTVKL